MNSYNPEPEGDDPRHFCDEGRTLDALREVYLEAGLSEEHARKSAAADYEHLFGCLAICAA
jgi:hypothetical protein